MIAASFEGVARFVWSRNRVLLIVCGAVHLVFYICNAALTPEVINPYFMQASGPLRVMPFILPLALFVTSVKGSTLDLAAREGIFPRNFFTLPVRASEIVLPFMTYAVLLAAACWALGTLVTDGRVMTYGPPDSPADWEHIAVWVPFVCASLVAWIQAISWSPFPTRWLRVCALLAAAASHAVAIVLTAIGTLSHGAAIVLSLVQFPLAYVVAVWGVARDRAGASALAEAKRIEIAKAVPSRRLRRFRSALDAQLWFENRIHRWTGKSTLIIILPAVLVGIQIIAALNGGQAQDLHARAALGGAVVVLSLLMLFAITVTTGYSFASFRGTGTWNQKDTFAMPAFFAALPLPTGDFVWAKTKGVITTMTWVYGGVLLLSVGATLLGNGFDFSPSWIVALRQQHGDLGTATMLVLPVLALLLFVLTATANTMSMILPGRTWNWIGIYYAVLGICFGIAAAEVGRHWGKFGGPPALLPVALRAIAVVKLCELAALTWYVGTRRLQSWSRLAIITTAWLATVGATLASVMLLLPTGLIAPLTAAAAIAIFAPVLGIIGAPLALHFNRCR